MTPQSPVATAPLTGEPWGEPLSQLALTAPLTGEPWGEPLSQLVLTAPLTGEPLGDPSVAGGDSSPYRGAFG